MNLVQAIYLNNQAKPFDNQLVRQALCYAIDRQGIMDMVADGHTAHHPRRPVSRVCRSSCRSWWMSLHDVAKAKELFGQAGYPDGFDLTICVPNDYQPHMDTAEVVAERCGRRGST